MLYASLMSLDEYLKDLGATYSPERSSIENLLEVERLFARYTFAEPELFYNIYFGVPEARFDEIFLDCFNLFENAPEVFFKLQFGKNFIGGGIHGRNLAMLEICQKDGFLMLDEKELPLLNSCIINMYRGFLDRAITMKKHGEDISPLPDDYLDAHRLILCSAISPEGRKKIKRL